jgi:hypothetical protein
MSKSIGKVAAVVSPATAAATSLLNAGKKATKVTYDSTPANNYMSYLQNYDTSKTDNTLSNLQNYAYNQSQNLGNMGDWNFSVNASDEARRQAQDATYNSYMDYLQPQFERQTNDYATMLQNKGLPVGSEAYERAMSDLQDRQNAAMNQAAYQSVLAGQQAYTQDLQNNIAAGNYGNSAQSAYLAQILGALAESPSEYDIQGDIYAVGSNKASNEYTAKQQTAANRLSLINSLLSAGAKVVGGASGAAGA